MGDFGGFGQASGDGFGTSTGFGNSGFGGGSGGFGNGGAVSSGFGNGGTASSGFGSSGSASSGFGNSDAISGGFGRGSGSNACFNCKKEGHRSADCPEPRKPKGSCFNCNQEGHNSRDCTAPRKPREGGAGGGERPRGCFNCGQEGHRSNECSEPRKPRERREDSGAGFGNSSGFGGNRGGNASFGSTGFGESSSGNGFGNNGSSSGFGNAHVVATFGNSSGGSGGGFGNSGGFGSSNGGGFGGGNSGGFGGGNSGGFGGGNGGGFGGASERPKGCFNCGQDGHRLADCPEPRKPREPREPREKREGGGTPGFGGGNSTGFGGNKFGSSSSTGFGGSDGFNSGQEHRPREGGAGPGACFNCGETGHNRSDCPKPQQPREDGSKPASTYVPVDEDETGLYANQIEKGAMFERFYDAEATTCRNGVSQQSVKPIQSFQELNLTAKIQENVTKSGYTKPTPVQQYASPLIMAGVDMLACAQTGSGKTAAFLLPIMSKIIESGDFSNISENPTMPRCLILAPTRELAVQIYNEARKFAAGTILSCKCIYGGTSVNAQKDELSRGANIIVGTTGRMKHFIQAEYLSLAKLKYLVLDEADRMLDMGFGEDVNVITTDKTITPKSERQTLMFSATFPPEVQTTASTLLNPDYAMVTIDKIGAANKCITQEIIKIEDKRDKRDKLFELLGVDQYKRQVTSNEIFTKKTLIFVSKKTFADTLGNILCEAGVPATTIHGDRLQNQRSQAMSEFVKGKKAVLVATAVAERGLDIKGVDCVINYDLPDELDQYIHRIGRTGRVGHAGTAKSLFNPAMDFKLAPGLVHCMEQAGQVVPDWLKEIGKNGNVSGFGGFGGQAAEETGW